MFENIIKKFSVKNLTISTMESCTGGGIANSITNVEGSSEVIKFSAVTYSNEFKIKMGVSKSVIDEFTVYSMETAREMSKKITDFTNSNFGVGVTGRINRVDNSNPVGGNESTIYISVYDRNNDKYYDKEIEATCKTRKENKDLVIKTVVEILESVI